MKVKSIIVAIVFAALTATGVASAATPVTSLSGPWSTSGTQCDSSWNCASDQNLAPVLAPDGVRFGPYADAFQGGTLRFDGANGLTLADLTELDYSYIYSAQGEPQNYTAAPYLRVLLNGDNDDVVFDPSRCITTPTQQGVLTHVEVTQDTVRYNDDGCNSGANQVPWSDVVALHGADVVSGIIVTQGFSVGTHFQGTVRNLSVNGTVYQLGLANTGPQGPGGATGAQGQAGQPGPAPAVTGPVSAPALKKSCTSSLRRIHAPTRRHEKFLSARASLRGKKLKVHGRTITVDLRGRKEGNYNVHISARYRLPSGKVHTVRSQRNLSVACS